MDHQDWKPVVFKKNIKKPGYHGPGRSPLKKLEESDEIKVKKFPPELVKQIIKYRVDKGMNRKQFAQSLNIKDSVLAEIESGKAKHNGALVGKFKRIINNAKKD